MLRRREYARIHQTAQSRPTTPQATKTQRQLPYENDGGDRRRRDDGADRRAGVDDAHRRRSFARGKPLGDDFGRGGEAAALARAEQEAAGGEHPEAGGQAVAGARERPEHHDDGEAAPRAEPIDERAAAGVHQRVGEQEHRAQRAELGVGERNVLLDGGDGDRQRLAIQIADRDGDEHEERRCASDSFGACNTIGRT